MMKCIIITTFKNIYLKHSYQDVLINAINSNAQSAEFPCSTLTICLKICEAPACHIAISAYKEVLPASNGCNPV